MRNIKLSLIATLCITGFITTNASALVVSNTNGESNNVALLTQIVKSKNIDKMVTRADNLDKYIEQYILLTGRIPSSIQDIERYFGFPATMFANYSNGTLFFYIDLSNNQIIVSHLFNGKIDGTTLSLLKNSSALTPNAIVKEIHSPFIGNIPVISYAMSPTLINFINQIKMVRANHNNVISTTAPSDTRKTWYQPDGSGHFNVYKYVNGQWKNVGDIRAQGIVVNSPKELENYNSVAQVGTKAYVKDGSGFDTYVFDGKSWGKINSTGNNTATGENSGGTVFQGATTIKNLATNLFNSKVGSVGYVPTPSNYRGDSLYRWTGNKAFFKRIDSRTHKGYWISQQNKYIVFDNMKDAYALRNLFSIGTIGYTVNEHGRVVRLIEGTNHQWFAYPSSRADLGNYAGLPHIAMPHMYPTTSGAQNVDDYAYGAVNPFITMNDGKSYANWKDYQNQYPVKYCYVDADVKQHYPSMEGYEAYDIYPSKKIWLKQGTKYLFGNKTIRGIKFVYKKNERNAFSLDYKEVPYNTKYYLACKYKLQPNLVGGVYYIVVNTGNTNNYNTCKTLFKGTYDNSPVQSTQQYRRFNIYVPSDGYFSHIVYYAKYIFASCPTHGSHTWYRKR